MSESVNQYAEDVLKLKGRIQVIHPSEAVSPSDVEMVLDVLGMRFALLDDLLPVANSGNSFRRNVLGLKTLDVQSYFEDWKTLDAILKQCVENSVQNWWDWQSFKGIARDSIHYQWILSSLRPFFDAFTGIDLFDQLNQWICFDSRLNLRDLNLKTQCCAEYLEDEIAMSSWVYPDLQMFQDVMAEWLDDYSPAELPFCPKHGPGAVANFDGRKSAIDKTLYFQVDDVLETFIRDSLWEDVNDVLLEPHDEGTDHSWRTCALVCVPKSPLKNRTISKEPVSLQWCQQGLQFGLDEYFHSHPELRIDLHHQEYSRNLCMRGSETGEFDTLDLSKASDSVTLELVRGMFRYTDLLNALIAVRSERCLVSDDIGINQVISLNKYAPMGSALCFPVECLVFACVCEAAVRMVSGHKSRTNDFRVYGDDIVIRHIYTSKCREMLELLHFTVNVKKSYAGQGGFRFREACGIECLNGFDVTPLRISRRLTAPSRRDTIESAGAYSGLVDFINESHAYGYVQLRRLLNYWASVSVHFRSIYRMDVSDHCQFGSVVEPYFLVDDMTATQWQVSSRYSERLWRREHYCSILQSVPVRPEIPDELSEPARLFLWEWATHRESALRRRRAANEGDTLLSTHESTFSSARVRWARKWIGYS